MTTPLSSTSALPPKSELLPSENRGAQGDDGRGEHQAGRPCHGDLYDGGVDCAGDGDGDESSLMVMVVMIVMTKKTR